MVSEGSVYYTVAGGLTGSRPPVHLQGSEWDGDAPNVLWTYMYSTYGWVEVTGYTDATHVTATVISRLPQSSLTGEVRWAEGAWYGYPGAVTFHQERLVHSKHPYFPERTWMSNTGAYKAFHQGTPVVASDALDVTLASKSINAVQWLESVRQLYIGSTGAEWMLAGSGGGSITPLDKRANAGSYNGSADVKPAVAEGSVLFIQQHGKIMKELVYSWESDAFKGEDLTILAEHLTREFAITAMVFQRSPFRVVWCIRADGKMLGLTYYKEQEVWGWHYHDIGGEVESVATIPGTNEDELWVIVKRYVNGALVRYVECMEDHFKGVDTTDAFFIDSGATHDGRINSAGETIAIQYIISSATVPVVVTKVNHGLSNGDTVRIRGVEGMLDENGVSIVNGFDFTVSGVSAKYFTLNLDGAVYDTSVGTDYEGSGDITGWDITLSRYTGRQLDIFSNAEAPMGLFFKYDGSEFYILDDNTDTIQTYIMSTPWRIDTAENSGRTLAIGDYGRDLAISADGTKLYLIHDGPSTSVIYQYTMSTPWDVATATYASKSLDCSSEDNSSVGAFFNSDGTKVYVMGAVNDTIYQYTMSTPWDISTATYDTKSFNVTEDATPTDLALSPNGKTLWVLGATLHRVYQYTLGTVGDISTAVYDTVYNTVNASVKGIYVKSSGDKMFDLAYTGTVSLMRHYDISGDSSGTVGVNTLNVTNLGHLVGETVSVLADGAPTEDKVVDASGGITLDTPASVVHAGLKYETDLQTLPPLQVDEGGAALPGLKQRPVSVILQMHKTLGFKIGAGEDDLMPYASTDDQVPEGRPAAMIEGFIEEIIDIVGNEYTREPGIFIRQDQPLPLTLLGLTTTMEVANDV
jgi:hypothetical protein